MPVTRDEARRAAELVATFTGRELRGRYRRTVLGHAWTLLGPLAQLGVLAVVFSFVLRAEPPPGDPSGLRMYVLWLAAGLLPWTFVSRGLTAGTDSLLDHAELVKKVFLPRWVLPTAAVGTMLISFAIEMAAYVVVMLLVGAPLRLLLLLPLVMLAIGALLIFVVGFALILSIANAWFRDVSPGLLIALQLWFYATPVVYPVSLVSHGLAKYRFEVAGIEMSAATAYAANPMVPFVAVFRALLYDVRLPEPRDASAAFAWGVAALVVGLVVFRRFGPRLPEEL